ncbi:hypothetical protein [Actinomycetospora sp. CA-053990]|uniref:hypothetical protein n=1 Tax=Actinomycetospora sp. CA-053990 TaxID=3239891 RepID=UPI003D8CCFF2
MPPDDGTSDAGELLVGVSLGVWLGVWLGVSLGVSLAWVVGWVVGSLLAGGWDGDGEVDGEPVPVEVDGAPLLVEVPDVGRPPPPPLPLRTTDDGPAGASATGRGAGTPGPGAPEPGATDPAGCARGCCSERRARSATVGVIVGEEVTDPTGAAAGAPHGSGVSSSVTAPGIATVVEDWLIVWYTAVLSDAAPISPTPRVAASRVRRPARPLSAVGSGSQGVSDGGSNTGFLSSRGATPPRADIPGRRHSVQRTGDVTEARTIGRNGRGPDGPAPLGRITPSSSANARQTASIESPTVSAPHDA